jgi:glycosyltransferase involved in cell wall biosynthesis
LSAEAPLRIAVGLHSPLLGGSQLNTIDLSTRLRERGHDVVLFVIEQEVKVSVFPIAEAAGFDVAILPAEASLRSQAARIRDLVDRHDAQVLHVYHEDHWLGPLAAIALQTRPGRAVVVTNWMMENNRWLPLNAPLILGTEALCDEARAFQRGPVWLLEPPVDLARDHAEPGRRASFRREHDVSNDEILAVLVTRVDRSMKLEGILRTISAVEELEEAKLRLMVVGDGDAMEEVRRRASAVNDALGRAAVSLTGALADPRPAYDGADIVLGMGGSAIRGLTFGKPVIVLGEGGFAMSFTPETVGYFLRHGFFGTAAGGPGDVTLAGQVAALFDERRRVELGAFGASIARERFDLEVAAKRLEQIYRDALADPPTMVERWVDTGYVLGYDTAHRLFPQSLKQSIRRLVPRLRVD